jgi:beta-xylosidase
MAPGFEACDIGLAVGLDALRWRSDLDLREEFADYAALGVDWLRTDLNWSVTQEAGPDSFDWGPTDRIVDLANEHGIQVLLVVGSTPRWAREVPGERSSPAGTSTFSAFLAAAVSRYRDKGVRTWEIWNEPNMNGFWPPTPDPVAYAGLLMAAYPAIKAVDPGATVLAGGLAAVPTTGPADGVRHMSAVEFLRTIYDQGAGEAFDAVSFHPYTYPRQPDDPADWTGWNIMTGPLRGVMEANGDAGKAIWITEYGAPTNQGKSETSDVEQADMLALARDMVLDLPWAGPFFWYSYRDLGDDPDNNEDWFGLVRGSGERKLSYFAFRSLGQAADC